MLCVVQFPGAGGGVGWRGGGTRPLAPPRRHARSYQIGLILNSLHKEAASGVGYSPKCEGGRSVRWGDVRSALSLPIRRCEEKN